jgi:hypothetical protein
MVGCWINSTFAKICAEFASNLDKIRESARTALSSLCAKFPESAADQAAGTWGRHMRFLLKLAFWFGVVLVLLPSGGSDPAPKMPINAGEAMSAAKAAVDDMRTFCERQAQACIVGAQTAVAIGHRAQAGAKMLYEFLNEQMGPSETGSVRPARADAPVPLPPVRPSQHTLKPGDLAPSWRGPQPPPDDDRPA